MRFLPDPDPDPDPDSVSPVPKESSALADQGQIHSNNEIRISDAEVFA